MVDRAVPRKKEDNLDTLNVQSDPEYTSQFLHPDQEFVVLYSAPVNKWNVYTIKQERSLIVTNLNIYNFHKKKLRRTIVIKDLAGLTKSLNEKSFEFVIHVKSDYDYRMETLSLKSRDNLFQCLKLVYLSQLKENLPIFGIAKSKQLADFCTSQKDVSRGISRMPLILARIYEEDTNFQKDKTPNYRVSPNAHQRSDLSDAEKLIENLNGVIEHRNNAQRRSVNINDNLRKSSNTRDSVSLDHDFDSQFDAFNKASANPKTLWRKDTLVNATFEDFELISIIGHGTFGKVYLVRQRVKKTLHAMKCIRKDIVIEHESVESLEVEKLILLQVNHPFIIGMDYVFQKAFRIYFIMDFIQGGELFKHLSDQKRFAESKAKFYAAQIALALGYLHDSKIIYRDLKPENILINRDGYIMLADFGLAKITANSTSEPNSFCGTPEYLSPEMIVGSGHDFTTDWWALGILIYEMIIGIPPFYNQNKHQMYHLIQHAPIRWPQKDKHGIEVSRDARDLISKMLVKDRKERLGQKKDVDEILGHPWFADLDMDKLLQKKEPAPYIPNIDGKCDLSNFDPEVTNESLKESILPEASINKILDKKDAFKDFGPIMKQELNPKKRSGSASSDNE